METLKRIYSDPEIGLLSADNLYKKGREQNRKITRKLVQEFLSQQYSHQIHKPIGRIKHYFPITSEHENQIVQIDLMDVSEISRVNAGVHFLLVCVDVFTRKAYVIPMKNKTTSSIIEAFTEFLRRIKGKVEKITCDFGSEFINKDFKKLCKENDIEIDYVNLNNHLIDHVGNRLGIVDSFIQKLRKLMNRYFDEYDTNKYIDVLDKLVNNINNTYNSGIKGIPNKPDKLLIEEIMTQKLFDALKHENKFNVGDHVRCVVKKEFGQKGAIPKWSKEIYTIKDIKGHSYVLDNGKVYKYYQLSKINNIQEKPKERLHERKTIRKERKIQQQHRREDIDIGRITTEKRQAKKNIIKDYVYYK